jgi:hypothetical protein
LMESVIVKVEKKMIASILKQHTMILSVDGWLIDAVVVNQQYYKMLEKTDVITYLQDIFSEVRWMPTQVKFRYMTKEDYLQQAMS